MFDRMTYLIWLALFIGLPLLALVGMNASALRQQHRALAWTVLGAMVGGWLWDAAAVQVGLWYYDANHIVGAWILGLPLEEWLWIVGVTLLFGGVTVLLKARSVDEQPEAPGADSTKGG